jgi:hypothetical protein
LYIGRLDYGIFYYVPLNTECFEVELIPFY